MENKSLEILYHLGTPAVKKMQNYAKMHQNTFGGRALSGPAGGALALPQTL